MAKAAALAAAADGQGASAAVVKRTPLIPAAVQGGTIQVRSSLPSPRLPLLSLPTEVLARSLDPAVLPSVTLSPLAA